MPQWKVKVEGLSDAGRFRSIAPAAAPPYSPTPYSVHGGLVRFAAAPGTNPVPSPRPPATAQRNRSANPAVQDLRPSDVAPDTFLPRLDVPFADNMQPPVRWVSTNEIPIPAANYVRLPQIASQPPARLGGVGVIPAPRTFPRWPSVVAGVASDG